MSAIVIIPCRYASTRFPGKPLKLLLGKPLIQHVFESVSKAKSIDGIFIATDNDEIFRVVKSFGGHPIMTSQDHKSGTDRIAEAVMKIEREKKCIDKIDLVLNVQGDEPMIKAEMIDDLVNLMQEEDVKIATLVKRIENIEDIFNPNVVKVVFDLEGYAVYFSRSPIPYYRQFFYDKSYKDIDIKKLYMYKHIGIYGYKRDFLFHYIKLPKSSLEEAEQLEQLRIIENGYKIKIKITPYDTLGVDTPEDLEKVERCLSISL
ncbi:MAG: 3-deoxy-manno-octulosonate cytidylyltransferase [Thermodesulfovibrionales bacterium]|nr:3-deoxy-manno-octulosonate cytidylyltransferase [Thermodesulfovibrionales bacterium]